MTMTSLPPVETIEQPQAAEHPNGVLSLVGIDDGGDDETATDSTPVGDSEAGPAERMSTTATKRPYSQALEDAEPERR